MVDRIDHKHLHLIHKSLDRIDHNYPHRILDLRGQMEGNQESVLRWTDRSHMMHMVATEEPIQQRLHIQTNHTTATDRALDLHTIQDTDQHTQGIHTEIRIEIHLALRLAQDPKEQALQL
jgi:hypothetical protein